MTIETGNWDRQLGQAIMLRMCIETTVTARGSHHLEQIRVVIYVSSPLVVHVVSQEEATGKGRRV